MKSNLPLFFLLSIKKQTNDMLQKRILTVIRLTLFFVSFFLLDTANAQTLPAGFSQVFVGNVTSPTAMAFAPDGRLFITEQGGKVRVVKNGVVLTQPFVTLSVNSSGERGLLGIAFDPSFASNNFIYLYYTLSSGANNRISRFTANGDVAADGSELLVLDLDPLSTATNHNGGTMQFGADGKLYVGVGENANGANSQNLDTYLGKILRINKDGSVPAGNPFTSGSNQKQRVWEYGLRNPYTITFQPGTGRLFVNDVGQNTWEEVDDATIGGKNFGWPAAEGNSSNSAYSNPIYAYTHGTGSGQGCAITGGTFFNPLSTNYPSSYIGKYFYIDYCGNWIDVLTLSGSTATRSAFATNIAGNPVSIITGTDGNLYFLSRASNALYKITYTGSQQPVITNQPKSISVSQGNSATFSVTATGSAPLGYQWRKDAVAISGATSSTYIISSVSTGSAGNYSVVVDNTAGAVTSNDATLTVTQANQKPSASITTPTAGAMYQAGSTINFSGTGTDPEDGTLAASSFKWFVVFHHATHTHPGPSAPSAVKSGSFNISNTGETATNVFYRLYLVVTDAQGAVDTAYTDINPRLSNFMLNTSPQGMQVTLDGQPFTAPLNVLSVVGMLRTIGTQSPQTFQTNSYNFINWSNEGAQTQTIVTASDNAAYTANFSKSTNITLSPVADAQVRGGIYSNTNYGSDVEMVTTNTGNPDYNYDSYLRFDISSLPANNSSVKLRLYAKLGNSNSTSITAQLFNVSSQNWDENIITYANKPAPQTTVLATVAVNSTANAYYELDITSHINALKTAGATSVSLVIKNATFDNSNRIVFRSKENTSNRPQLVSTVGSARALPYSINKQVDNDLVQANVYPNPAKGRFTIVYAAAFTGGTLQLFDAGGRMIKQQLLTQINNQIISTGNLQNGVYTMLLQKGNKKLTRLVVIKK